jgi:hypothetical protein
MRRPWPGGSVLLLRVSLRLRIATHDERQYNISPSIRAHTKQLKQLKQAMANSCQNHFAQ